MRQRAKHGRSYPKHKRERGREPSMRERAKHRWERELSTRVRKLSMKERAKYERES